MPHQDDAVLQAREAIVAGETALGIELGSTRIKATLIGPTSVPLATGSHAWSNQLVDRLWTYDLERVTEGVQRCYADLAGDVSDRYGVSLTSVGAMGCSAMMHGYLAFDDADRLLVPFRTWRNTNTDVASRALTDLFDQNIPHRWSVAHLYQAILDDEEHLSRLAHITTLAGYVHWQLTGERVVGVGDASGMFPIDVKTGQFDEALISRFDHLIADRGYPWRLSQIVPTVMTAGQRAGTLTADGCRMLDPTQTLRAGTPVCPPEGDAGTGMVATNSVEVGSGNVSAGTSIFAMVVLEQPLSSLHREIDLVTTPAGDLVAMVHCNNGTSDLDAWVSLFLEFAQALG
ncbi:MAG: FGGY family carbohydrate kinase, partial [Lapillicoccus sp.]